MREQGRGRPRGDGSTTLALRGRGGDSWRHAQAGASVTAAATIVAEAACTGGRALPVRYPERLADAARQAAMASWRVT